MWNNNSRGITYFYQQVYLWLHCNVRGITYFYQQVYLWLHCNVRGLTGLTVYQNDSCKLCYFLLCCKVDRFKLVHDFRNSKTCTRVDSVRSNKMISKKCLTLALKGALLYFFLIFWLKKPQKGGNICSIIQFHTM